MPVSGSAFATSVFSVGVDGLDLHPNPVTCIVMGSHCSITVESPGERVTGDVVVIQSGREHRISCTGGLHAMFLDGVCWTGANVVARRLDGRVAQLAEQGMRLHPNAQGELRCLLSSSQRSLCPRVRDILAELAMDPMARMTQAELSGRMGIERTAALRLFKAETGMTFRQFKRWSGLQHAANRIVAGDLVRSAALDAGFADTSHLTRTFRQSFGLTPSQAIAGLARLGSSEAKTVIA